MHPFTGQKALYHVRYWEPMLHGQVPSPVLVTLDPVGRCNLRCIWCNGDAAISRSGRDFDDATIDQLPLFLEMWGVKAVCIAGGGEPLLHKRFSDLAVGLAQRDIEVGVVTNGTCIEQHKSALGACRWVGVSVDTGDAATYARLKGADSFHKVCDNIAALRAQWAGLEVTYKYLIHPENIGGIEQGAINARELGCSYFHARPAGIEWWQVQAGRRSLFTVEQVAEAADMMARATAATGPGFVIGTFDKFRVQDWGIRHDFRRCYATGMTCVISADHTVNLCCDRRGDDRTQLCEWSTLSDIRAAWGSRHHLDVMAKVNTAQCPRCTYAPHNELFEQFAVGDTACKWFI